ncbi:MAG: type I DNA topoisomerase [Clostridiales bacterium]|nr:type I DNA topoisomerase [Clostridiales bacterium]
MASENNLVIVESPAKAKTLKKFLGKTYKIEATMGHVRDLPKSELGIDVENDFEPKYITIRGKGEVLAKLRREVKSAKQIYLATDPDREGEAISWHLLYALKLDEDDKRVHRVTFNEITKTAVKKSVKEARQIDMDLVNAQQARRILDRIVGYKISPLLWAKVKKGLSAGRVQSVALKLICDRQTEIDEFIPNEYWSIQADLKTPEGKKLKAKLTGKNGKSIEIKNKEEADAISADLNKNDYVVKDVKKGSRVRNPVPPFTTSTMQQEASKQLNFSSQKTMSVAQQLYEGVNIKGEGTVGLVTYIRTDSVRVADEAYIQTRDFIRDEYGEQYVGERREYKVRAGAQDAHEAIRPSSVLRKPSLVKDSLTNDQFKLYKLIWGRFVASQMPNAVYDTLSIKIANGDYNFSASGSRIKFDGYLLVYKKNAEKAGEKVVEEEIPECSEGSVLKPVKLIPEQHFTQPPARYTEALFIKTLEENGVGRPSTYAPTIGIITARNYVTKENKLFYPTELGIVVNEILKNNFGDIVNVDFTAEMERQLDEVEEGKHEWKQILRDFYPHFKELLDAAMINQSDVTVKEEETDEICEVCGRNMVIKFGRYGKFLACPGFPECRNTKPYYEDAKVKCPKCGGRVLIKKSKKGRIFYGCENNPDCDFISWNKPTGGLCPECGSPLVEKGGKNKKIVCSGSGCEYKKDVEVSEES